MPKTVKVRFPNGVLTPLEPLDLVEADAAFQNALGAWRGTHDPEELIRQIYADRLVNTRAEARL